MKSRYVQCRECGKLHLLGHCYAEYRCIMKPQPRFNLKSMRYATEMTIDEVATLLAEILVAKIRNDRIKLRAELDAILARHPEACPEAVELIQQAKTALTL